ncbi:iron complex transport system substrate-binding protein [Evansella caseinilytica]|uniref:Iron complex transport system substrate-binding protein n=1 Tax=Evansella caseinilytica TaxID=1503961 RepID=A0A1H3SDA4_9BACI|nr:ABC transporter substrate-binding protein [Evansella caseinilytica]SDZ35531.1 iron complex transport system substrate-binding protein [Evansella caseinilytica]
MKERQRQPWFSAVGFMLLLLLLFFLSGCSTEQPADSNADDSSSEDQHAQEDELVDAEPEEEETVYPLTITDLAGREITFERRPERIVSVIPADMEIIYALGGEVVGRPQATNGTVEPEEAAAVEEIGYPLGINYETIVSLQADLFIGHTRLNVDDVSTLQALELNVILSQGDSMDDIKNLIHMYGDLLDRKAEANALIADIEKQVADITAVQREEPVKVLILFGTRDETMAALPQSLAGNLFELAGAENISAGLPHLDNYPTYAQLSLERILEADPDAIYFMAHGDAEEAKQRFEMEMSANPAWNNLNAVKNNNIIVLPHELFGTNPGPRIVDALAFLKDSLDSLEQ